MKDDSVASVNKREKFKKMNSGQVTQGMERMSTQALG